MIMEASICLIMQYPGTCLLELIDVTTICFLLCNCSSAQLLGLKQPDGVLLPVPVACSIYLSNRVFL